MTKSRNSFYFLLTYTQKLFMTSSFQYFFSTALPCILQLLPITNCTTHEMEEETANFDNKRLSYISSTFNHSARIQALYFDRYQKLLAPTLDPLRDERVRSNFNGGINDMSNTTGFSSRSSRPKSVTNQRFYDTELVQ